MDVELHRFILIKNYFNYNCSKISRKKYYEFHNIIERWILSWAQDNHYLDPIFSKKIYNQNHEINQLFLKEMENKGIKLPNALDDLIKMVKKFYHNSPEKILSWKIHENYIQISTETRSEKFYFDPIRKKHLMKKHSNPEDFVILVIRYACLFTRGQQWNVPMNIFYALHEKIDFTLEAFASPFNSLGLIFNVPYCSIFEIDKKYGSVGNFFNYELLDSDRVFVNPPFILEILNHMANLDIPNAVIFTPEWSDALYYEKLQTKPYNFILSRNQYYYEFGNKIIKARFPSHIWSDFPIKNLVITEFQKKLKK